MRRIFAPGRGCQPIGFDYRDRDGKRDAYRPRVTKIKLTATESPTFGGVSNRVALHPCLDRLLRAVSPICGAQAGQMADRGPATAGHLASVD